jgi:hypothetical protein
MAGRTGPARAELEASRAILDASGSRLELARTLVALGRLQDGPDATASFERAAALYREMSLDRDARIALEFSPISGSSR